MFRHGGWCADYPDQQNWLSILFASSTQRGLRDFGYRNAMLDAILGEADRSIDQVKRDNLYLQASRTLSSEAAWIWLAYSQSAALTKPWVGGLNVSALDGGGVLHPTEIFVRRH